MELTTALPITRMYLVNLYTLNLFSVHQESLRVAFNGLRFSLLGVL